MAYVDVGKIKSAGQYVLFILRDFPAIRYSDHFYDGSEEFSNRLCDAIGLARDDSVETYIDTAIWQLEQMGYVRTTELESLMADDERDSEIAITDAGRRILDDEVVPKYFTTDH